MISFQAVYVVAVSLWTAMIGINRFGRVTLLIAAALLLAGAVFVLGLLFALNDYLDQKLKIIMVAIWGFLLVTGGALNPAGTSKMLYGFL